MKPYSTKEKKKVLKQQEKETSDGHPHALI